MNTYTKSIIFLALFFISSFVSAQNGILRGRVIDNANAEPIMFGAVVIKELSQAAETDIEGNYEISLKPGTYSLVVSYVGYKDYTVSDVIISADKVTVVDMRISVESQVIEEVVVTATQIRNTESAISTIKQRNSTLIDGISSQTIKRNGDGNAGEALRRVTGVSIEGGKHAVVRGLGDRYTKIILNGVEIPGLDPDKNSVQMDLFPTNIVDNLLVYKSFSPELPGDFTGGAIDIITKDFPEQKTVKASIGLTYNPFMHFKNNFLTYEGGSIDFLGFDDGTRALPFYKKIVLPDPSFRNPALTQATKAFTPTLATKPISNDLNKSLSFSLGNQKKVNDGALGYIFGLNYNHGYTHYDNFQLGEYFRNSNDNGYFVNRETSGTLSEVNTLWSALGAISYKKGGNKISIEALRVQSADAKAALINQANMELNSSVIKRDNLEYYERAITNIAVSGKHAINKGKITVDWKLSPTITSVDEPDIRTTGFDITEKDNPILRPAVGAEVTRIFRNLQELNYNGRADVVYNFKFKERDSKIKGGVYATMKERDFEIYNFLFRVNGQSNLNLNGNAANILLDENIWTPETNQGAYIVGNYEPANTFNAKQNLLAAYLMNELPLTSKLKVSYGLRAENATTRYNGQNNQGNIIYVNQKVFDKFSILPSANVIYALNTKTNLRASYNRTLARPTFKENSIAQIQDRITDRTFLGNIGLKQTDINNYDLRLEKFFGGGDLVSVSAFFKQFYNPIQLTVFDAANPTNFIPRNFDDADVLGFELEASKKLGFISEKLSKYAISSNFTKVNSTIPLVGLSPTLFNVALSYIDGESGWEASATYNVQGKRLSVVGIDRIEDIYEIPFKSLNARISKQFGPNNIYGFSLLAENLLASKRLRQYETVDNSTAIFDSYSPGRQITCTFSYSLK